MWLEFFVPVVQSLSHVRHCYPTDWSTARILYPLLSPGVCSNSCPSSWRCYLTISYSVAPFSSCPQAFPAPWSFPVIWLFAKFWSFNFSISSSKEYSGLISFRIDWLDLLAVQGTLKSILQHRSSKSSILQLSAFFMVQPLHPHMTTGKTIALTIWTFVSSDVSAL